MRAKEVRTLNKHRHYPAIQLKQKNEVNKSSGSEHVAKVFDFGLGYTKLDSPGFDIKLEPNIETDPFIEHIKDIFFRLA